MSRPALELVRLAVVCSGLALLLHGAHAPSAALGFAPTAAVDDGVVAAGAPAQPAPAPGDKASGDTRGDHLGAAAVISPFFSSRRDPSPVPESSVATPRSRSSDVHVLRGPPSGDQPDNAAEDNDDDDDDDDATAAHGALAHRQHDGIDTLRSAAAGVPVIHESNTISLRAPPQ